jgi:hypothetical protein
MWYNISSSANRNKEVTNMKINTLDLMPFSSKTGNGISPVSTVKNITPMGSIKPVSPVTGAIPQELQSQEMQFQDTADFSSERTFGASDEVLLKMYSADGKVTEYKADGSVTETDRNDVEKTELNELNGKTECKTCAERKYQDVSDDSGVSFQTPTHVSAEQSATAVMGHEREHEVREGAKASVTGREVISSNVRVFMEQCPECKKMYAAGGETRTTTKAKRKIAEQNAVDAFKASMNPITDTKGQKLSMVA